MFPRSNKFGHSGTVQGRSFHRLSWNKPSRTVAYGHREIHVHPNGRRRLSILEAMLLQGFPQRYKLAGNLSQQVTQVSNAVPPPLARSIARSIHGAIYQKRKAAQAQLLTAHRQNGRSFPWRHATSTFHLLVAEKLLQQTAAGENVVHAYEALTEAWPTAAALAAAPLSEIQRIIRPLGFQYRAAELVALSQALERKHNGCVPLTADALLALPGVGEYTANAILSFSGTKHTAVVDTNVSRLLFRLLGLRGPSPTNPARHRRLQHLANWLVAGQDARAMNYAVLDLTAETCGARRRACSTCPLNQWCVSKETLRPAV
jgi:adenine-specific DNA glycosylase